MSAFPRVERDDASADFFDAAARGELLLPRSPDGREPFLASGEATLVSWAVVHRPPLPWLADAVPYVCAVVELAEGPWLTVRLVDADPAALVAGAGVRARFVPSGTPDEPGETLPVFAPAGG